MKFLYANSFSHIIAKNNQIRNFCHPFKQSLEQEITQICEKKTC